MKKAIMVIKDIKGEIYIHPHVSESVGIAIRDFTEEATNEKKSTPLSRYPADYDLLHVGWFDPEKGEIESIEATFAMRGKHIGQKKRVEKEESM